MKKISVLFILSVLIGTTACTQTDTSAMATSFLTADEIPTVAKFMPLPPKPTDPAFENDQRRYEWGKTMRKTKISVFSPRPKRRYSVSSPSREILRQIAFNMVCPRFDRLCAQT